MKKVEEKNKIKKNTYDMLDWQKQNMAENLRKEKELNDFEANRLKEEWAQDIRNEKIEKERKNELNKQLYIDIEEFNKKELEEKKRKDLEEKNRDRELIDAILKKEKNLDDLDKKEKVIQNNI
jgi:hypothetical protein